MAQHDGLERAEGVEKAGLFYLTNSKGHPGCDESVLFGFDLKI